MSPPDVSDAVRVALESAAREDGSRVLALLARRYGDLDVAEDAVSAALENAVRTWPRDGVPTNPAGWLLVAARRAAIDRFRTEGAQTRRALAAATDPTVAAGQAVRDGGVASDGHDQDWAAGDDEYDARLIRGEIDIPDERLRLVLLCAHPALATDAQVALTLRLVVGLRTPEIAAAFLVPEATLAQRIVRAKRKIRAAAIPLMIPADLTERLDAVLTVIYLVFTEGHFSAGGGELVRVDLAHEAIRLAAVVDRLVPGRPEVLGLQALLSFHHSRRDSRTDESGDLVLLGDQDRSAWRRDEIERANRLLGAAMRAAPPSRYVLMAVIAALHANATGRAETDWVSICRAYEALGNLDASPVVTLNHAVAVAERDGPGAGLRLLEPIVGLDDYHAFHVVRSDLLDRVGRGEESRAALQRALALSVNDAQRRHLQRLTRRQFSDEISGV